MKTDYSQTTGKYPPLQLPLIPFPILTDLCQSVSKIFQSEPNVLEIRSKCIIIGDLHGHLLDLFRIFRRYGLPPNQSYLFLGDIVDRGEFSTETCTLIFVLKVLYPKQVFIIRGNHEFAVLTKVNGFSTEISQIYDNSDADSCFIDAFSFIPLAAIIGQNILCVHGGIGPNFTSVNQLYDIKRPIHDFDIPCLSDLLWSDPNEECTSFIPSDRGEGFYFGETQLNSFCQANSIYTIIRGHECVDQGIQKNLSGNCITVFSASNYCGISENKSAVLLIQPTGYFNIQTFPPLPYLKRSAVKFMGSKSQNIFQLQSSSKTRFPLSPSSKSLASSHCECNQLAVSSFPRPRGSSLQPMARTPLSAQVSPLNEGSLSSKYRIIQCQSCKITPPILTPISKPSIERKTSFQRMII